jgi:hypothetical protein
MIRNSMRSTRLLSWRCLRWAIVIPALPFLWWACTSHPLTQPNPEPEMQTDVYISVAPVRLLDLVFMVDNSPSMAPKVEKMNAQFPKLIKSLEDPSDHTLPDVRVAVINSDLGTAGAFRDNSCAAKTLPDGTNSIFGDLGRFQMLKKPKDCTFNDGALFLEYKAGQAVNYTGDINTVFACLASNLGTMGCGEEHSIQAFEFALAAQGVGNDEQQKAFLRRNAYLGLVFLTDEDDCSAATNDRLFGDIPDARGDSASLRCATRAHKCGGRNLSGTADDLPHYPTTQAYTHPFNDCEAWIGDWCGNDVDTSQPTPDCNPLRDVTTFAEEMKGLRDEPDDQILVAGIFGWPMDDPNDPNVFKRNMEQAEYKIAKVPNPNTADTIHPQVYDYWPVCYDPDHKPSDAKKDPTTGFDVEAAGWGATGGLRNAAFVDQFGENGLKFSICQRDFSDSLKKIGDAIAKKLQNLCVDYKLVDTLPDGDHPGVQADCRVVYRVPQINEKTKQLEYIENSTSLPQCGDGATPENIDNDCWYLTRDKVKCETNGQLIQVMRTRESINKKKQLDPGTKIAMQCRTCTDPVEVKNPDPNVPKDIQPGCDYTLQ